MHMSSIHNSIHIHDDLATLGRAVAQRWLEISVQASARHGHFHVALSGGSTPRYLYEQLVSPVFSNKMPWDATHIYFGDERCVPPDHQDSNFHMANDALLQHVPIPLNQIHRIEAENPDQELCAAQYEKCLYDSLPDITPGEKYIDLMLLGLGTDGHIASLFPDTEILREHTRLVAPVYVEKLQSWRISMTFAAIRLARHVIILVAGNNKADIISQILGDRPPMKKFPVEMIHARSIPEWHLDSAAAIYLRPNT